MPLYPHPLFWDPGYGDIIALQSATPPPLRTQRLMWRGDARLWLAHVLATVPKVTQSALEYSQSVEPRPEIKRQLERRGGNEGQMKRGERRWAFSFFI